MSREYRGRAGVRARNAKLWLGLLGSVAILSAPVTPKPASAQEAAKRIDYAIPAGSLGGAISRFGDRSNLQILYPSDLVRGKSTGGAKGTMSSGEALARILAGSNLSYRFTGPDTVTLMEVQATREVATTDADGMETLEQIDVLGGRQAVADAPYGTPGSVAHISREQLDRAPGNSAGDVFISTPGVIAAGNRVGASIDPNIRGMQGNGRVNTTVDGARQTSSSYRGYVGSRDETYVDPDMIGGIDIAKGPSGGAGVGGIGGSVNFRTLTADDIIKDGHSWGGRVKAGLSGNTSGEGEEGVRPPSGGRPGLFDGDGRSGSVAVAGRTESFEAVAAYSRRKQGNYFTGEHAKDGIRFVTGPDGAANTIVGPKSEAPNTSQDVESVLIKGKAKWGEGQSLELGYMRYDNKHGEISELQFAPWLASAQNPLSHTKVDTYTAKYRYTPDDGGLLNFRANLSYSDLDVEHGLGLNGNRDHTMRTINGDIGNTAVFDTRLGALTVDGGAEFVRENGSAVEFQGTVAYPDGTYGYDWQSWNVPGRRNMYSGFASGKLDLTDWLAVGAGGRFDAYDSRGEGYASEFRERSGSRFSPNATVTVTPLTGFQLYAQYKEGHRPPTLRETYWRYGTTVTANENIKPERSQNHEIGLNVMRDDVFREGDKARFKAAYFFNRYKDYVVRTPADPLSPYGVYFFNNIDRADFEGIELSGGYDAGLFFVEAAFTKYFDIKYCDNGKGCSLPSINFFSPDPSLGAAANYVPPEYSGSVTAGVRLFDQALTLGGRMHFGSERFGDKWKDAKNIYGQVGYQFTWPSYQVFDLFASYKYKEDLVIDLGIENVTDRYYFGGLSSVGIASPGRTGRASVTYRF